MLTYLGAEHAYAEAIMASTNDLRDRLLQEITSRVEETDLSVPDRVGEDFYYTRWEEGQEHPIYARRRGSMDAPEQVLLDVNRLAADGAPIRVRPPIVSPGQDVLAFHVHFMDQPPEHNVFRFKNLDSGELFEDEIPGPTLGWSGAWGNDDRTFFYVRLDPGTDPWQVRRHVLGTDPAEDEIVHAEQDLDSQCLISRTRSGRYLVITSYASGFGADLEERLLDADRPTDRFELFLPQAEGHVSDLEHGGDHLFFRFSDQTGDPQIFRTPIGRWDKRHWEEVISERDDATMERYWLYREHMVVVEKKHGLLRFLVHSLDDGQEHYIDFGEPAYQVYGNPLEFGSRLHRYTYSSPSTPMSVYTYDMETRETVLVDQERVGPDYDPKDYVTERLYAPARDGVLVPVSIGVPQGHREEREQPSAPRRM